MSIITQTGVAAPTPRRFRTILADPPWDIQQRGARGAETHYDLMTLERIKAMPVADLAEDDAHLWLWVTNATLRHGYDVAEAWGFTVRSPLTWIKFRLGLGNYLRNSTEHLLFATKGRAPVNFHSQPTWSTHRSRTTRTNPRSSTRSSSGSAPARIWSYSPAATRPAPPAGRSGATRSTPTSASPATRCPGRSTGPAVRGRGDE